MKYQKKYWERKEIEKRRKPTDAVVREYVVPKIDEIQKHISIDRNTRLLDVGCGNGFFSYYFDKICNTTGVDYSSKMIELNPVEKKHIMDANNLEFEDDSFNVVFCHAVLHHVEDVNKVIKEMSRVSKKYVVILEPNRNNIFMFLFSLIVKEERKALKFSLNYLKRAAELPGLKIISSFSYGMIVPNRTPKMLLPFMKLFNFRQPFGMTNFIISEKTLDN